MFRLLTRLIGATPPPPRRGLRAPPRRAGLGLFDTLIAIVLFGLFVVAGITWMEERRQRQLAALSADQLAVVASGARTFIDGDFPNVLSLVTAGGGSTEITLATLRAAGALAGASGGKPAGMYGPPPSTCMRESTRS